MPWGSSSKLTWKKKSTRNLSFWDSSSSHQQNQTQQNFPIYVKLSPNSYLRSSQKHQEPLPSFFNPATAFILLKNAKNHCLRSSQKPQTLIFWAWVLMVAWEEWSTRMTTPLQNSLRLEFYVDYNSTFMLPAYKTWVSKTQILHGTPASKAQDVNFVNSLKSAY